MPNKPSTHFFSLHVFVKYLPTSYLSRSMAMSLTRRRATTWSWMGPERSCSRKNESNSNGHSKDSKGMLKKKGCCQSRNCNFNTLLDPKPLAQLPESNMVQGALQKTYHCCRGCPRLCRGPDEISRYPLFSLGVEFICRLGLQA